MKVQDFSDKDILNYLMVSEFNEGLTPDEFKFLLYKFRYLYRLSHGKTESLKYDIEKLSADNYSITETNKVQISGLNQEKQNIESRYNSLVNRRLSWKERIKGKIIIKEDEINRI